MFWDAYTHSMPHAEWFGELSMWLLLFLALRYGVTLQRIPNPDRRREANVRRQDGEIQFDLMCRRPPERRCHQIPHREPQPSISLCAD
ncbi:hypothetical protein H9Q72_002484 [Fusarium xylarioides]|uniref:Uncharacterized protein n=1 Tax=Fusarium xylarioides TaxID=221167 RepID=A0A9P7LF89_9HYPO|nr:hypothetical protein H9Q70_011268 [Fusarium xylarioides]KAG5770803.1 hypothetical protein H9Q72_002484 [Fusarium xylarioides]KAG5776245.1 hypothetical protein H9Q73_010077 [Fusarium xylarioides]KAG5804119.1 hypothetical protein H9Q71_011294 [Fusarium xylarioides]KAG5816035.1 hypothetical protein H9Q74_011333 [Fusarium xylarioides]